MITLPLHSKQETIDLLSDLAEDRINKWRNIECRIRKAGNFDDQHYDVYSPSWKDQPEVINAMLIKAYNHYEWTTLNKSDGTPFAQWKSPVRPRIDEKTVWPDDPYYGFLIGDALNAIAYTGNAFITNGDVLDWVLAGRPTKE